MAQSNVYQMVTDRIVSMLNKGIIPWQKPWFGVKGNTKNLAISYVTRRAYSQINQWLLGEPGEYLTFNEIQKLGGSVCKGAKSRFVVFYTRVDSVKKDEETGEEKLVSFPLLRYYNVFHINDTKGIASKIKEDEEIEPAPMDEIAEGIINGYLGRESTLRFLNDKPSNRAYYSPSEDMVVVPMPAQFKSMSEYYSTTFHELTHSTLPESRCNRKDENKHAFFGNEDYSREELVAEIGSAMLCSICGIDVEKTFKNSVAYIQSWIKVLKNDIHAIIWASSRAEKAARYILGEVEEVRA